MTSTFDALRVDWVISVYRRRKPAFFVHRVCARNFGIRARSILRTRAVETLPQLQTHSGLYKIENFQSLRLDIQFLFMDACLLITPCRHLNILNA